MELTEEQTKQVTKVFPPERRVWDNLTFEHYFALVDLPEKMQDELLELASAANKTWSVERLKKEVETCKPILGLKKADLDLLRKHGMSKVIMSYAENLFNLPKDFEPDFDLNEFMQTVALMDGKHNVYEKKKMTYSVKCDCGEEVNVTAKANPGAVFGCNCSACGALIVFDAGGEGKYSRGKSLKVENAIMKVFLEQKPRLTVRQIYYALSVAYAVPKTEAGYRQTCYALAKMRRAGQLPYGWIADNTRWTIKPKTYTGLAAALFNMQELYRRDLWEHAKEHVEVWVEKDALAGVISPVTSEYDVPLYVARGYSSMTFLYEAAEQIKSIGKPAYIYHFGDFDPSGVDAAHNIRDSLRGHGANIHFERVAVTEEQVEALHLPTRPTKTKDSRAAKWEGKPSVELDALPAQVLRDLVRSCIEAHINKDELLRLESIEKAEKQTLSLIRDNLVQVQK